MSSRYEQRDIILDRPSQPMKKNATIATVAAAAGVAVSTVSRYLNGHYVSQPVRARLGEVIETLGYSRSWWIRAPIRGSFSS